MARIALATVGTLGDLHPFLALASALKQRGHEVIIATAPQYRARVRREALEWRRLRPDTPSVLTDVQANRVLDRRYGLDHTLDDFVVPALPETAADLLEAAAGADVIVGSTLVLPLAEAAERLKVPYVRCCLQPMMFYSAHDFWIPPDRPWLRHVRFAGAAVGAPLRTSLQESLRRFEAPMRSLRRNLGLPEAPVGVAAWAPSPWLNLALFSSFFGQAQRDWPANTLTTGFLFHDGENDTYPTSKELFEFLDAGDPPIVATLGSSAVHASGDFYQHVADAALALGRRALLLTGAKPQSWPCPPGVARFPYAPLGLLMPRAAAIVHQGGIGTIAQALRAATPMLVVPFAYDQEDNAARAVRLGVGRRLDRGHCGVGALARALKRVLNDRAMKRRCVELSEIIAREDGPAAAARAVEALLASSRNG